MKIRTKLLVGFGVLMGIMIMLTVIGYDRLGSMNSQLDNVYEDRYLEVRQTAVIRAQVNDMAKVMANLLLNPGASVAEGKEQLEQMITTGDITLKAIQGSPSAAAEQILVKSVETSWGNFKEYESHLIELLEQGQFDQANAYRNSTGLPAQETVLERINTLSNYQDTEVDNEIAASREVFREAVRTSTIVMSAGLLMSLAIILWVLPSITRGLGTVSLMITGFGKGRFRAIQRLRVTSKDEIGQIAQVFKEMAEDLEEKRRLEQAIIQSQQEQTWLSNNTARVMELLRGVNSREQIAQMFISEFTPILGASYGSIYLLAEDKRPDTLLAFGSYAGTGKAVLYKEEFRIGEGLIGQSAMDRQPVILDDLPPGYLSITSSLGSAQPSGVMIYPIVFEDELLGVAELAAFNKFGELEQKLFSQLVMNLGVILNNVQRRMRVEQLLRESQALTEELQCQSEELQSQQEELKRSNENLEQQTEELKRSEELLQRQQEELEHYNTELMAKTRALEEQVREVEEKNLEIEKARSQLEQQAMQLAVTSKYKSEFLANMSHELRTPLNSLLILSQLLSENKDGNLNPKQVEYAHTIYMSGADLLKMIDEILDLSKVDAGKMEINYESVSLEGLERFIEQHFAPVAAQKELRLVTRMSDGLPKAIISDGYRLKQILRNLLSNAFKFTASGSVEFTIAAATKEKLPSYLNENQPYLMLSVRDTGIGIAPDKTDLIFEAFQQVDGTTSRKYGGTGLGLSISRELSRLLGGGIELETVQGEGSCFTLYLPAEAAPEVPEEAGNGYAARAYASREAAPMLDPDMQRIRDGRFPAVVERKLESEPYALEAPKLDDDRDRIGPKDKVLLIIEDDIHFANILIEMARSRGYKALSALQGDTGLEMAKTYLPDAIILDIQLPVLDGWSILGELKSSAATRHIPVHVISVIDDIKQGLMMGAIAYLKKPSTKESLDKAFVQISSYTDSKMKRLLIVEDNDTQRQSIIELIEHDDVAITAVSTGKEALAELGDQHYDCMVLDLMLADMTGFDLLDRIRDDDNLNDLPIIIYTGKELDSKEEMRLRKYAESIIIKDVKSPERLLDETTLFLHRVEANLPEDKRRILQKLYNKEELFEGKHILLVDDDIRNVFALSSVLEDYRMNVTFAENGKEALELLQGATTFDLVLMDMMMPEMDGYETMRHIRDMPQYEKLPIIALTAKAMKDDRAKCIEAGASDYVKKPIQTDQLLSLMRVWLYS
ncbi:response regulator [Paenibacillus sp. P96]|uniref:histidine kinase n=1 Tax=Paenibacillus zeirhizosphaerae TaxID=2987519 RepID=A0ABT9FTK8_9BACL|nr:response regulator [Paenibacillus sp. P96]MDP4098072.1 response regulator [Paenibacillus sp. P96]